MTASTTQSTGSAPRAEEVLPGVFQIACPFGEGSIVYVYYLDGDQPALVDTGVKASPTEVIEPALRAAGKPLANVRFILNTHGHWDHMGGNEAARRLAPQARVYLHENDKHLMESADAHVKGYSSYAARLLRTPGGLEAVDTLQRASIEAPAAVDEWVTEGQTISLGGGRRVRAVSTPGHSRGSTSYLLEDQGALFTGDAIQGLGSRPRQLPLVFDDSQSYRATILKVSELGIQALCMGHAMASFSPEAGSGPVRCGQEAQAFLKDSGEGAKAVEEAARSILAGAPRLDFDSFARQLVARLAESLSLEVDQNGLNPRSMATIHAYYRELTGAPLPA
jgi:glyoxylase-like metal-dependent hydrolase (beta-lactamase superfamily II)